MSLRDEIEETIRSEVQREKLTAGDGSVGSIGSDPASQIKELRGMVQGALAATLKLADEVERLRAE